MRNGRRASIASIANARWARDFGFGRAELVALFILGSGGVCRGSRGFLGAKRGHARRLDALGFGCRGLLLGGKFGRGLRGRRFGGRVLLSRSLHVRGLPAPTNRRVATFYFWNRNRLSGDGGDGSAAATRGGRRRGLLFGASSFLSLPPGTNASDLVVGEHAHVASDRNVHMPKKGDHFFGQHSEFVCQLTD